MDYIKIGATGLTVCKNAFGALPMQRISVDDAAALARRAYEGGITYFDTARAYTDSEKKLGVAFEGVRERVIIATKTMGASVEQFWAQLAQSLSDLKTDYIDFYQFHNPAVCPKPGDGSGLYEAMLEAKAQGKIRHIGITNHRLPVAIEAMESGLYEIIQFPFSYLSTEKEENFVCECEKRGITVVAMKSLSGGLITNSAAAYAYANQFPNVLPIWGVQRPHELEEFLSYNSAPPELDAQLRAAIERDRAELGGEFCRGCGYCMPCLVGIDIPTSARMSLLLRRAPLTSYLTDEWTEKMERIERCKNCGHCKERCPYGLDTPTLLRANLADYREFIKKGENS
jgi:aryl-alcohol dehydrogenase-like predicted oxidoreductase